MSVDGDEKGTFNSETEDSIVKQDKDISVGWIWDLSRPERPYLYIGLVGAMFDGAFFPLLGYFLAEMIGVFFNPLPDEMRKKGTFWAGMFLVAAGVQFCSLFTSKYCFGVMTERLAAKVRIKSFAKMLDCSVEWHDHVRTLSTLYVSSFLSSVSVSTHTLFLFFFSLTHTLSLFSSFSVVV